jgi:hypothetical protein
MSEKFEWMKFAKDFGALTLSLASGGPTVVIALVFYLRGAEPPHSGILTSLMIFAILAAWGQWWKEYAAHKNEIAVLKETLAEQTCERSRDWNGDWLALEKRFREFKEPVIASCYSCDGQESWLLEGFNNSSDSNRSIREFQEICRRAVGLFRTSPGVPANLADKSRAAPDDFTIWLSHVRDSYGPWRVLQGEDVRNGRPVVATSTQLSELKKLSAMACEHWAANSLI